jgi:hypothetical protein
MECNSLFVDEEIPITGTESIDKNASCILMDVDKIGCLDRISLMRKTAPYNRKPIFGYTNNGLSENEIIKLMSYGIIDVFEFPEDRDWILCQCEKAASVEFPVYPSGDMFPLISKPSIFTYDDSATELTNLNMLFMGQFRISGRTSYKDFEDDFMEVNADVYLIDLVSGEANIGFDLIEMISDVALGSVVAYSRMTDPAIKTRCVKVGAHGYIEKGVSDERKLARMKQYAVLGRALKESQ